MPDYTGLSTGNIAGLYPIRDICQTFYILIRLRKRVEMGVIGYSPLPPAPLQVVPRDFFGGILGYKNML
jgi:hypothetical protein